MNETVFGHQLGIAALFVYVLEMAKRSNVPWFTEASDTLNRITSILASVLVALGIHIAITGNIGSGYSFSGTIPSLATLLGNSWDFAVHFSTQVTLHQAIYHKLVKPEPTPQPPAHQAGANLPR